MKLNLDYKELSLVAGILVAGVLLVLYWFNGVTIAEPSSFNPDVQFVPTRPNQVLQDVILYLKQVVKF